MSFREQTRWCWMWGLIMLPLLGVMYGGAAVMPHRLAHLFELLMWLVLFEIGLFLSIGGVIRPASKFLYHAICEGAAPLRSLATLPLLREWFWLTPEGKNRDA
jgi:hypothetical protein